MSMTVTILLKLIEQVTGPSRRAHASLRKITNSTDRLTAANQRMHRSGGLVPIINPRTQRTNEAVLSHQTRRMGLMSSAAAGAGSALVGLAAGYATLATAQRAFDNFRETESALNDLKITAGATEKQMDTATEAMERNAVRLGRTVVEQVDAVRTLVQAGVSLDDALAAYETLIQASKASGASIEDIGGTAVAMMKNLGITVDQLERAFDSALVGGKMGRAELNEMASVLPEVAAAASEVGFKGQEGLESIVAMMTVVREVSGSTAEAATKVREVFTKLLSPTTIKAAKKYGIDLEKIFRRSTREGTNFIEDVLDVVEEKTNGDPIAIGSIFTDLQARQGIQALVKFADEYDRILGRLRSADTGGEVLRDAAARSEEATEKLKQLNAAVRTLSDSVVEYGSGPVADGAQSLAEFIDSLDDRKGGMLRELAAGMENLNAEIAKLKGVEPESQDSFWKEIWDRVSYPIVAQQKALNDLLLGKVPGSAAGQETPAEFAQRARARTNSQQGAARGGKSDLFPLPPKKPATPTSRTSQGFDTLVDGQTALQDALDRAAAGAGAGVPRPKPTPSQPRDTTVLVPAGPTASTEDALRAVGQAAREAADSLSAASVQFTDGAQREKDRLLAEEAKKEGPFVPVPPSKPGGPVSGLNPNAPVDLTQLRAELDKFASEAGRSGQEAGDQLASGVGQGVDRAGSSVDQLAGRVVAAVTPVKATMYQEGLAMMQQLAAGIRDGAPEVQSAARAAASAALAARRASSLGDASID